MLRNELYKPWFVGEKDWGFEIVDGEFAGVCIQIEKLEFAETSDGTVKLEYHVVRQPESIDAESPEVKDNPVFTTLIETIINDILREAIEAHRIHEQQNGSNDSTESSSQ